MEKDDQPAALLRFADLTEAERFALELRWYEGRMLPYFDWLMAFVERHRSEILFLAHNSLDPDALLTATKQAIVEHGSLRPSAELKDQIREIENELWFRGEKGDFDRSGIQVEWTAKHAVAWRRWRIREYLFVVDRCANRVVARLNSPAPVKSDAMEERCRQSPPP